MFHGQYCQRISTEITQLEVGSKVFQTVHTPRLVCGDISITREHLQQPQLTVEKESNLQCSSRSWETAVKFVAIVRWFIRESAPFVSPTLQELETCLLFKLPKRGSL